MQIAACTSFSTAISSEGMPTAATEIDFFCGHWLTSAEHRGMSASGQKAEYSSRADVFCFGPDEDADAAYSVRLLRTRRKRRCNRCAAKQGNEFAPSHKVASDEVHNLAHDSATRAPVHCTKIRLLMSVRVIFGSRAVHLRGLLYPHERTSRKSANVIRSPRRRGPSTRLRTSAHAIARSEGQSPGKRATTDMPERYPISFPDVTSWSLA
jgi:hypothetical protein